MSTQRLTLVSVAGSLTLPVCATADFVGLAATSRTVELNHSGVLFDVFELYATFDSADDGAFAVRGTPLHPNVLDSGGDGFFQALVFGNSFNTPVPDVTVTVYFPGIAFDSMLSIGVRQGFTGSPTLPTIDNFNLADFNGGASTVITTDGGWFVAADAPVAAALPFPPSLPPGWDASSGPGVGAYGVMLGQFAVAQGNTFSGDLGQLSIYENGVERIVDSTNGATFSFTQPIPAPGVWALFGILGCMTDRRRRKDQG